MKICLLLSSSSFFLPALTQAKCHFELEEVGFHPNSALLIAFFYHISSRAVGVVIPTIANKWISSLYSVGEWFLLIKVFSSGLLLAIVFIHNLQVAFNCLISPFLRSSMWHRFSFTSFITLATTITILAVDTLATRHYSGEQRGMREDLVDVNFFIETLKIQYTEKQG